MTVRVLSFLSVILWVAATAAQSPPTPPESNPEAKEETCVVSGVVVQAVDGAPLKGAMVRLVAEGDNDNRMGAKTGPDGRFELKNIHAGQYRLHISRNGFVATQYGQKKPGDPGATLRLLPGDKKTDLLFRLKRAAVITGRVSDADGEPMSRVAVSALRQQYEQGKKRLAFAGRTESNDLGEFRLYELPPGRYYVSAEARNWAEALGLRDDSLEGPKREERGYGRVYYPGVLEAAKATTLSVKEGEEIPSIDFLMKEVTVYRVSGKVANQVSKLKKFHPQVQLLQRNQPESWGERFMSQTKADGEFEITEVTPGEYTVLAYMFEDNKFYATQEDIEVTTANITGLRLSIGPGVSIPGRVLWEGQPNLTGEEETVYAQPPDTGGWIGKESRVDEKGEFLLKEVPDGLFSLGLQGISKDCYIKEIRYGETILPEREFRVAKGASANLEITISSRGAKVEGRVSNEDNLPVAGAWAVVIPELSKRKLHYLYKVGNTDQFGHFEFHGLPPGKYKLFAWEGVEAGIWEDEDFLKGYEDKGILIEVKEADAQATELKLIQVEQSTGKE
jgi:hypothetical protein